MNVERPDLDKLDPAVRAYIEALDAELDHLRRDAGRPRRSGAAEGPSEPSEPPTTLNVISISTAGMAKRTPRHLYSRQRRGGMGVFDLETPEDDPPAFLTFADESQSLILLTNQARAFRLPVGKLPESPVHSRGQSVTARLSLNAGERLALVLPDQGGTNVALLTRRGHVRWFAGHLLGEKLRPGIVLYEAAKFGPPTAACWAPGDGELFIATRRGRAIRFAARQVPVRGCLGIRLDRGDTAVAIAAVRPDSGVFLLSADGRGTIRLMSGFRPNKAPGGGGKIAIKTDHLTGATAVADADDIFIVSRLSKLIRFRAVEVPPKEGVVQGVNCMALRADETVAVTVSPALIQG
jgi:DNA gyrase subunit A